MYKVKNGLFLDYMAEIFTTVTRDIPYEMLTLMCLASPQSDMVNIMFNKILRTGSLVKT